MAPDIEIDRAMILRLAGEASVDPRTIRYVLAGRRVRGMAYGRALRVLREHGLAPAATSVPPSGLAARGR
jgi:hypothetical protein